MSDHEKSDTTTYGKISSFLRHTVYCAESQATGMDSPCICGMRGAREELFELCTLAKEIVGLREACQFVVDLERMTFAECTDAEAIVRKCKEALGLDVPPEKCPHPDSRFIIVNYEENGGAGILVCQDCLCSAEISEAEMQDLLPSTVADLPPGGVKKLRKKCRDIFDLRGVVLKKMPVVIIERAEQYGTELG